MNKAPSEARIEVNRVGRVVTLVIDNPAQRNALRPEFSTALAVSKLRQARRRAP